MSSRKTPDRDLADIKILPQNQKQGDLEREIMQALAEIKEVVKPMGSTEEDNVITGKAVKAWLASKDDEFWVSFMLQQLKPLLQYLKDSDKDVSAGGYRKAAADESKLLSERFLKYRDSGEAPVEPIRTIESFVTRETETWLDVAFVRAAINQSALTAAGMGNTSEVAKLLFGENSRVEKSLMQFQRSDKYENVRSGCVFVYGATMIALGAALAAIAAYSDLKLDLRVIAVMTAFSTLAGTFVIAWGISKHRHPYVDSRKYISKKYEAMDIPPEAERFVDLSIAIQEHLKKLESAQDEKERMAILREMQPLTTEAKESLRKNSELFAAKAHKPRIRIEEFQPDPPVQTIPIAAGSSEEKVSAAAEEDAAAVEEDEKERRRLKAKVLHMLDKDKG